MAYQSGAACYPTASAALMASASGQVGGVVTHAGVAHVVNVTAVDDASITYQFLPAGGGVAVTLVAPMTPEPCGLLDAADGFTLGWLIAGAWIATYAVLAIKHALAGETGGNYGNT